MLKMKQAEHDKVVTALCEKHEEEINKLKSHSDGLVNQIATKAFNDGFNNGSRHAQIAIYKGFVDLIQELYVRGAKQIERERTEGEGAESAAEAEATPDE
jgi:hypothetical protein